MNRFLPYILLALLFGCDNTDEQLEEQTSKQETEIRMPVILGDARYVGRESCVACHTQETDQFTGSHHDLAMQHANSETVLGDFANAEFYANDVKSTFFKKDDKYFVTTDGVEGELEDFEIKYTFGVTPLQQSTDHRGLMIPMCRYFLQGMVFLHKRLLDGFHLLILRQRLRLI